MSEQTSNLFQEDKVSLSDGFTLPPDDQPVKELSEAKATSYGSQLALASHRERAAEVFGRKKEIARQGNAVKDREIIRQQDNNRLAQENQERTAIELQNTTDTIGTMRRFQEINQQIKAEEIETKVIKQFKNSDVSTNRILLKKHDAVEYDTQILEKELAMSNLLLDLESTKDGFFGNLADLFEELGPSDIELMIRGFDSTDNWKEHKQDLDSLPVDQYIAKYKPIFENFDKRRFFDNPDKAIALYGVMVNASYDDAQFADMMNVFIAATTIGGGTLLKLMKSIPTKVALGRKAVKGPEPTLSSSVNKEIPDLPAGVDKDLAKVRVVSKDSKGRPTVTWTPYGGEEHRALLRKNAVIEVPAPAQGFKGVSEQGKQIFESIPGRAATNKTPVATAIEQAITNGIKGRSQTASTGSRAGGDKLIADDVVATLKNPKAPSLISGVEQVGWVLKGKTPSEWMSSVGKEVAKVLKVNDDILEETTTLAIDAVSNEIKAQTLTKVVRRQIDEYSGGSIFNVTVHGDDFGGQVTSLTAHVGAETGKPFATKELAEEWMKINKLKSEAYQTEQGGWLVDIARKGGDEIDAEVIAHVEAMGMFKALSRHFLSPSEVIDPKLQLLSNAAEQSMSHVHTLFRDVWKKGIAPMKSKESVRVQEVMQAVQRRTKDEGGARWLSPNEFIDEFAKVHKGMTPTDRELTGYLSIKQLEDANWKLLNRSVYRSKKNRGYKDISYTGNSEHLLKDMTGASVHVDDVPMGSFILDESSGMLKELGTNNTASISLKSLQADMKGKVLIELDKDMGLGLDGMATHALVNKASIKVEELSLQQMGYLGGGRIAYDYNFIVSGMRSRTYKMFGNKKVELPHVGLAGGVNRAETKLFAKNLDDARAIAHKFSKKEMTRTEANTLLHALKMPKFQEIDEVGSFLQKRGMKLDDKIAYHADGEVPLSTGGMRASTEGEVVKAGIRNRLAKARTSLRLEDVRGGYGIISPLESLAHSTGIASRHAAFGEYRTHALNMFNNSYGQFMKTKPNSGAAPIEVMQSGIDPSKLSDLSLPMRAEINSHRDQILNTIRSTDGWAAKQQKQWQGFVDDMSDKIIFNKSFGSDSEKWADKLGQLRDTSLTGKWKAVAFQSRMGIFAMPQFLLQASMAPSIMAMSPKHGLGAMLDIAPTRMALLAKDPVMIKDLATKMNKGRIWSRQEADEFVEFVEVFKGLGINDFGASLPELAGASNGSIAASSFDKFLDAGQIFFREGEMIPRITAAGIAARKIREQGIKLSSDKGKSMMVEEVNRLTFGITGAGVQSFNRGMLAVGTQFWSFPMRMMTAMFGKTLTAGEKAGFIGSMALMYGAGGIPMGDQVLNYFQKQGMELDADELSLAYKGLVDEMIYQATDGEVVSDFSSRQLGSFIPSLVETFTEDGVFAFLAGPTGSGLVTGLEVIKRELEPMYYAGHGTMDQVTDAALGFLAANITSVDRVFRGWLAAETGMLRGRKGTSSGKMDTPSLIAWGLGVPDAGFNDAFTTTKQMKDFKDYGERLALEQFNLTRRVHSDPENSQVYLSQIAALTEVGRANGLLSIQSKRYGRYLNDPEFVQAMKDRRTRANITNANIPDTASSKNRNQ